MPDDTAHLGVIDRRESVPDTAFRGDREARAALSAWLKSGAEILRRCRMEGTVLSVCRASIADNAMDVLMAFDGYRGRDTDPLEYAELRRWVERELTP